ncbi:MAG TPA: hypothetical protein DEB06_00065, partial [Phycisphaerales bacterium]|nr:hypothetical protein [Phycisphaerales bacterium]
MSRSLFQPDLPADAPLVRVVIERGLDSPDGLTYAVPPELGEVKVGDRVRAPLGRHDRAAEGLVVEVLTDPADIRDALAALGRRVKPLLARAPARPKARTHAAPFPPGLLRLAEWISHYYCCPLGMVLGTMVPAAVKRGVGARATRVLDRARGIPPGVPTGGEPLGALGPSARAAWARIESLAGEAFPVEPRALRDTLGLRTLAPINRLVRAGLLVEREVPGVRARQAPQHGFDIQNSPVPPP